MARFLTLFLLFFLAVSTSKAQPYESMFGDSSTEWTTRFYGPTTIHPDRTIRFFVEKDTAVGNHVYKKISTSIGSAKYNDFLLREELDSGKVYCLQLHTTGQYPSGPCTREEFLYLDYNLAKGDSFFRAEGFMPEQRVVDSVYYENNRKHIVFALDAVFKEKVQIIEGTGFTYGMSMGFHCSYNTALDNYLFCYFKDGVQYFTSKQFPGNCYPFPEPPTNIDEVENPRFFIAPNPAGDILQVKHHAQNANANYRIWNMYGQQVKTGVIEKYKAEATVEVENLPAGMYSISIGNFKRQTFIKK